MIKYATTLLLILLANACSSKSISSDLTQYCELYNPKTWEQLGNEPALQDVYGYILEQQAKVVVSPQVKEALAKADRAGFNEFYQSVKNSFSELLGKQWTCEYFEDFFKPTQKMVLVSLQGVTKKHVDVQANNVVTVMCY